jgi:hypothetical protein
MLTKIMQQTPEETGFPGRPITGVFSICVNKSGFPGLIAIFQKLILLFLNFKRAF